METDLAKLQADIAAARGDYLAVRQLLLNKAGWVFADGPAATDAIESFADELGPDQAAQQFLVLPQVFGDLGPHASDQLVADTYDDLEPVLERLLDAQDRLDLLTRQRVDILAEREPGRLQVVIVRGREFSVDVGAGEIRAVDDPNERYPMEQEVRFGRAADTAGLSLTEQFAQETGAGKAEPRPERDRTRGR